MLLSYLKSCALIMLTLCSLSLAAGASIQDAFSRHSGYYVQHKESKKYLKGVDGNQFPAEYYLVRAKQLESSEDASVRSDEIIKLYRKACSVAQDPWLKFNAMWALVMLERMNISEIRKGRQDLPVYSPLNEPAKEQ